MQRLLLFLLLFCSVSVFGQYKRHFADLFSQTAGWTKSGWLGAIGATYTLPVNRLLTKQQPNANLSGSIKTFSFPGIYAEIGRFHLVPAGIIFNNIDYSIAFKQMNYRQNFDGTLASGTAVSDKAEWEDQNATINLNFNSIIQFADFQWIQPTLGIHGDYRFGGKRSYSGDSLMGYTLTREDFTLQIHAKLAYGAKLTSELFIVPSIEIGLWQLNNLNNLRIPKTVFYSNYTPIIFTIKFLLHRPLSMKPCDIEVEEVDLSNTKRSKKKPKLF